MKAQTWLWPDRNIGKRESRQLREEHNELVNLNSELVAVLQSLLATSEVLFSECEAIDGISNEPDVFTKSRIAITRATQ